MRAARTVLTVKYLCSATWLAPCVQTNQKNMPIEIVKTVHDGGSYVSPELAARLLSDLQQNGGQGSDQDLLQELSHREVQILTLIGQGLSNKEIGQKLDIKEKTVKHYVTNILQKLQVRNRTEAALLLQRINQD